MNHAKALAIVTAYDMYLECAERKHNPQWSLKYPVGFHRFREKLAIQMLHYDPRKRLYKGDEKFRVSTQQNQAQRRRSSPARSHSSSTSTSSGVGEDEYSVHSERTTRLCGFLDNLIEHSDSVKRLPGNNGRVCVVCGGKTSMCCGKCGKAMHASPPDTVDTKTSCFLHYHNTGFFGLARDDCRIVHRLQRNWTFPTLHDRKLNSSQMKDIDKQHRANKQPQIDNENADNGGEDSSVNTEN